MTVNENPLNDALIDGLAAHGWAVAPGYFAAGLMDDLCGETYRLRDAQAFQAAGTGKTGQLAGTVRTDRTLWLDGGSAPQRDYAGVMESLRLALNRALFLGLFDYESHYALYAPGGFYKKHIDSLKETRNRVVSCVTYLTPGWRDADAGHLVLYAPDDAECEVTRVLPGQGTLAVFLSEAIPHEVLPPKRERASIAGWFRCNESTGGRVDPLG